MYFLFILGGLYVCILENLKETKRLVVKNKSSSPLLPSSFLKGNQMHLSRDIHYMHVRVHMHIQNKFCFRLCFSVWVSKVFANSLANNESLNIVNPLILGTYSLSSQFSDLALHQYPLDLMRTNQISPLTYYDHLHVLEGRMSIFMGS